MLRCHALSNAITAAHDSILNSIRQALRAQCPHFTQHWCTTAGSLFPGLTAEFSTLAARLNGARFVNLERQVPDAIFVQDDGARVVVIELARTNDLVEGYWRDRRAAKDENIAPSVRPSRLPLEPLSPRPPSSSAFGADDANRNGGLN